MQYDRVNELIASARQPSASLSHDRVAIGNRGVREHASCLAGAPEEVPGGHQQQRRFTVQARARSLGCRPAVRRPGLLGLGLDGQLQTGGSQVAVSGGAELEHRP